LPIVGVEVLTAEGVADIARGAGGLLRYRNIPEMKATNMPLPAVTKAALTSGSAFLKALNSFASIFLQERANLNLDNYMHTWHEHSKWLTVQWKREREEPRMLSSIEWLDISMCDIIASNSLFAPSNLMRITGRTPVSRISTNAWLVSA